MRGGRKRFGWVAGAALCAVAVTTSGCGDQVSGSAIAAEASDLSTGSPDLADIAGEWTGTYTCAQGDTGLTLTIEDTGRTEFEFYPLGSDSKAQPGRFEMEATVEGDRVEFEPVRWIHQPAGYLMVDLVATEVEDDTLRGRVTGSGCSTFRVHRDGS